MHHAMAGTRGRHYFELFVPDWGTDRLRTANVGRSLLPHNSDLDQDGHFRQLKRTLIVHW